jgi:hAT family C-terminal dimerisation region
VNSVTNKVLLESENQPNPDDDYGLLFGGNFGNSIDASQSNISGNDEAALLQEEIANEMQLFRTIVSTTKSSMDSKGGKVKVLDWWNQHHNRFPHVAAVARKWLGVPSAFPSNFSQLFDTHVDVNSPEGDNLTGNMFLKGNWDVLDAMNLTRWGNEAEMFLSNLN